jgi:uncharacterized damage-inducible protein DinB
MNMPNPLTTRYCRWFDYEKDAHAKVVASLESVPPDRRGSAEFRKAVDLLAHISGARRLWLCRLGIAPPAPGNLFPTDANLDDVIVQLHQVQELWTNYLNTLTDSDLDRVFEYQSLDAGSFRNRVEDILTQLFGHSWYHRGQIARLVRASGGQPAATDFVFWCREPV